MFLIPPLLGLVSQLVPSLIGLFAGSQAQDVAQKVVSVAQVVTGTTTQEDAHAALVADPVKAAAVQAQLAQLAIDATKAQNSDRDSARAREIAVKDHTPAVLGAGVTLGFFALIATMVFVNMPPANIQVLNILLGVLGTGWMMVLGYYYGASAPGTAFPSLGGATKGPLVR